MNILRAITSQILALCLTIVLSNWLLILHNPVVFLLIQSSLAVSVSSLLFHQPYWWAPIHLLFLPCAYVLFTLTVPSWLYFVVFLLMTGVFWGTIRGDVPLYLSSSEVAEALIILLKHEGATTFADLGSGIGSIAIPVATQLSGIKVNAWEQAPLPWLFSKWRGRNLANFSVSRGNFFAARIDHYDVVYAFLSPAVMTEVSKKIKTEMHSGSLFISSSFPATNWIPESVRVIKDRRETLLYCYRIE